MNHYYFKDYRVNCVIEDSWDENDYKNIKCKIS